ncbi:hypothetical protein [Clostridium felsineum]|uniref:Uncharacterized protein n=1 Tax=Clostridium felsineum TaxID=36839 RepID=A0A1S8LL12_9CLOT|nr:hypothetical protein [Clostridium felsineum]URZ00401.1 hypothetical protein CLAUR_003890 [Clostridium felsineum]URZ06962.1 hypothetical protein CLROS_022950 [Clostridium felsineum]URZ11993.1 hypothetical protein CROST_027100 [Clostridium felsineum]
MKKLKVIFWIVIIFGGLGLSLCFGFKSIFNSFNYELRERGLVAALPELIGMIALLIPIIVILRVIVLPILRSNSLSANGIKNIGFIKNVVQTGSTMNNQPGVKIQLEVIEENGERFLGEVETFVQLTELSFLKDGYPIPIMYNPEKKTRIMVDPNPDLEKLQDKIDYYSAKNDPTGLTYEERREIRRNGKTATALIEELKPMNNSMGKTELQVSVSFKSYDGSDIKATRTMLCNKELMEKLQIGGLVELTYIPGKEEKFAFKTSVNISNM